MKRLFAYSWMFLGFAAQGWAYIQNTGDGVKLRRTDNTDIQMLLNEGAAPGLLNANGIPWITAGSNVPQAVNAALSAWNSSSTANIYFAPLVSTALLDGTSCSGQIGVLCSNVIAFDNTGEDTQAIGGAIAITVSLFLEDGSGTILKSDIIFSPALQFATNLAPGTYDIQSIVTHELGHVLGSSHSGVLSATMFWSTGQQDTDYSRPQPDDLAFVSSVYPRGASYGSVTGLISDTNRNFLRGALISVEDPISGIIIGGFSSLTDGTFSFLVPPGSYRIWAEPLGGQIKPANVYLTAGQVDEGFQPIVPTAVVNVVSGVPTSVTLTAEAGASSIQIAGAGAALVGSTSVSIGPGSTNLPSAQTLDFFIEANGLGPGFSDKDITIMGPVSIQSGSVTDLGPQPAGELYEMTINVAQVTTRTAASLFISYNGNTACLSGGIVLLPAAPAFPANGIGNVFSYQSNAVAPGEIVAIFGTNLGPAAGTSGGVGLTGDMATYVGGVQVTFDGQPAPIFYASAGQINVQVPFEVAGRSSTSIVVNTGTASEAVVIPVQSTLAGLFAYAVNFSDGKLNSAADPVAGGDYVVLYTVGLGVLETPVATGSTVSGTDAAENPVTISFGGQIVTPYYAGASPGYVGLGQINVQAPLGLSLGPTRMTAISAGQTSSPITVFVQ